jgi:REP element-mobilizing transposase RayT
MVCRLMSTFPVRRHIRLSPRAYESPGAVCSVTICLRDRSPRFADAEFAAAALEVLRGLSTATGVAVVGYCLMPDHVHLLLSPSEGCDLVAFVGRFKNLTQRRFWERGKRGTIWQKSFWDHFLRADEDIAVVLDYILNNPVRAGLVPRWRDYRFAGSWVYEL